MTEAAMKALQDARHELDSLGGLWVTDATEASPHDEVWQIDTTRAVEKIEQALEASEQPPSEVGEPNLTRRIEVAYDEVIVQRQVMLEAGNEIRRAEDNAKAEHADEWAFAKNNDVRKVMLAEWLSHDNPYIQARIAYDSARNLYRLALLEIERLKLLVELAKAGGE